MLIAVGAQQMRQHQRVPRIGLGPRHRVPIPIAVDRFRVDRIDPMPSRAQRRDQQPPVSLDRHIDSGELAVQLLGQHRSQLGETGPIVADASTSKQRTGLIDDGHIMVTFGPVDTAVDLQTRPPRLGTSHGVCAAT
jgi:hypothetical protein